MTLVLSRDIVALSGLGLRQNIGKEGRATLEVRYSLWLFRNGVAHKRGGDAAVLLDLAGEDQCRQERWLFVELNGLYARGATVWRL